MKILDLLFPPRCISCGDVMALRDAESALCPTCRAEWEYEKICCDDEDFGTSLTVYNYRLAAMEEGGYAAYLVKYIPSRRKSTVNRLIYHLKNTADKRTVRFVSEEFYGLLHEAAPLVCTGGTGNKDTVVTWIPRSRRAKLSNGFDHMERCAKALGKRIGAPVGVTVVKAGKAKEQKTLTQAERIANANSSMRIAKGLDLTGKIIVLIDDIITSGASVNSAAKLIKAAGAEQVIVLTLCATSHGERNIRKSPGVFN